MKQRFQVRKELVQAIYTNLMRTESYDELLAAQDDPYGKSCLEGVCATKKELDEAISQFIEDDDPNELYRIDHAILLLAAYELKYRPDVPYKVVIDQAIRLAKTFSGDDGFKLVNAVVDRLAQQLNDQSNQ